jgi:oligopeptide transport system permease protein
MTPDRHAPAEPDRGTSLFGLARRRLARNRLARVASWVLVTIAVLAALAPLLPFAAPEEPRASESFRPPSLAGAWRHGVAAPPPDSLDPVTRSLVRARLAVFGDGYLGPIFGTDSLGRCLLSRLVHGSRVSLLAALFAAAVSLAIGVAVGAVSGWRGGRTDLALMRLVDVFDSVPLVFVVIFVQSFLRGLRGGDAAPGSQIYVFFAILGAITWITMARLVRGQVLSLRERPFVDAARTLGAPASWIIRRHVLPNLLSVILVALTLTVPRVMLFEAFLSFLGLGVESPAVSLGVLARAGLDSISVVEVRLWLVAVPGLALGLLLYALNVLGDAVRDAFDPRLGTS